jgi:hypothetical protein
MPQYFRFILVSIIPFCIFGCAHAIMRGSVATKLSETEAQVCMGNHEVKIGDRVKLFDNVCTGASSESLAESSLWTAGGLNGGGRGTNHFSSCTKTPLGMGTVTHLLNEHYSVVKFDEKVKIEPGTFVEKQ